MLILPEFGGIYGNTYNTTLLVVLLTLTLMGAPCWKSSAGVLFKLRPFLNS